MTVQSPPLTILTLDIKKAALAVAGARNVSLHGDADRMVAVLAAIESRVLDKEQTAAQILQLLRRKGSKAVSICVIIYIMLK